MLALLANERIDKIEPKPTVEWTSKSQSATRKEWFDQNTYDHLIKMRDANGSNTHTLQRAEQQTHANVCA